MIDYKDYTILVVDDDKTMRNTIAFDFKRKGFTVLSASNCDEAFQIIISNKVSLVVSDVWMEGGDGISLLERIRTFNPVIPYVILVTGFADLKEEDVIAKGAKKILVKPFDRKTLICSVLECLGIKDLPKAA